jgi:hypothetical protein
LIVSVPPAFRSIVNAGAEGAIVKLPVPVELIVKVKVVETVSVPEAPVMVMMDVPFAAVALAVNVRMLLPVAGLGVKAAVTPAGRPDTL